MTYALFLLLFLVIPSVLLGGALRWRWERRYSLPIAFHSLVALIYTTPWDNHLVASRVWWYNPERVMGITIGWVPLEEYAFFVLQPVLTGLWMLYLHPFLRKPTSEFGAGQAKARWGTVGIGGLVWLGGLGILALGWQRGAYLGWELGWFMPPILLQCAFGADILWLHRRWVFLPLLSVTFYLSVADALAIRSGIWTISPDQSVGIRLGGVLPLEEFVFFTLTNALIVFGITLLLTEEGRARAGRWLGGPLGAWVARSFAAKINHQGDD